MAINAPDLPFQEDSDISNPFRWFESFVSNNLPYRFRDDFFSEAKRFYQDQDLEIDYENVSATYTLVKSLDGWPHSNTWKYSEYLEYIFNIEKEKSRKLIIKKTESCNSESEISFILNAMTNQLTHIINMLKKMYGFEIREFPCIPLTVYEIVEYMFSAHHSFLPNPLPDIFEEAKNPPMHLFSNLHELHQNILNSVATSNLNKEPLEDSLTKSIIIGDIKRKKNSKISSPEICGFEWQRNPEKFTLLLYQILIDHDVIKADETDFDTFSLAFTGNAIQSPLNIKWHLLSSSKSNKAPIFRMFFYLADVLNIIKSFESDAELARKVENIFVDTTGQKFKALTMAICDTGVNFSMLEIPLKNSLDKLMVS